MPKGRSMKERIDKLDFIRIGNVWYVKDNVMGRKWQVKDRAKILAKNTSNFLFSKYKELYNSTV